MRDDIPAPAIRLLCSLPVRTHIRPEQKPPKQPKRKRIITGEGRGSGQGKPIKIRGVLYKTEAAARAALHVCNRTLKRWLAEGKAVRP